MRFVKTQKILYNTELRIRLIIDNNDPQIERLVMKLPECKWSKLLDSWHIRDFRDHISYLNYIFPSSIRFYDISFNKIIPEFLEEPEIRKIRISHDVNRNSLLFNFRNDLELSALIKLSGGQNIYGKLNSWKLLNSSEITENIQIFLRKSNYQIKFENIKYNSVPGDRFNLPIQRELEKFRKCLESRNYDDRTINQYASNLKRFFLSVGFKPVISPESVRDYFEDMSITGNFSRSYQNQHINSVKAYLRLIRNYKPGKTELPRPRRKQVFPDIISQSDAEKIIKIIPNLKHSTVIKIIYLTGISVSELVSIKLSDINRKELTIFIRGKKEKKCRLIPINKELINQVNQYLDCYDPENYLFEGYKRKQYSERNIQKVIRKYSLKAGINKKTNVQTMRSSFAVRLFENGADRISIMQLLGHKSIRSSECYSRIAAGN